MKQSEDNEFEMDEHFLEQLKVKLDCELSDITVSEELIKNTLKSVQEDAAKRAKTTNTVKTDQAAEAAKRAKTTNTVETDQAADAANTTDVKKTVKKSRVHSFRWVKTGAAVAACLVLVAGYQIIGSRINNNKETQINHSVTQEMIPEELNETAALDTTAQEESSMEDAAMEYTVKGEAANQDADHNAFDATTTDGVQAGGTEEGQQNAGEDKGTGTDKENYKHTLSGTKLEQPQSDSQVNSGDSLLGSANTVLGAVVLDQKQQQDLVERFLQLIAKCNIIAPTQEISDEWGNTICIIYSDGSSSNYEFGSTHYIRETRTNTDGSILTVYYESDDLESLREQADKIISEVP